MGKAESTYRAIYNNAVEGIYQSTLDGRYLMANKALAQLYGYASPDVLLANLNNISSQLYVEPQRRDELTHIITTHGYIIGFESEVYRQDGTILWISENGRLVLDEQGHPSYYEGFVTDISDRKRVEAAHRLREARAKAAFEQAAVGFVESNMQTAQMTLVNQCFCQMTGYSQAELLEMTVDQISHPDDVVVSIQKIHQLFSGEIESFNLEKRYLRQDGSCFWADTTVYRIHLQGKQDTHCLAIVQDISDRKQAQQQLQSLNQALEIKIEERTKALTMTQSAVDLAADCVFLIRSDGSFHYTNDTACARLGYSQEEFTTMKVWDINPTVSSGNWEETWQAVKQQQSFTTESQHRSKDGAVYPIEINTKYLIFDDDEYCFSFVRDISERKRLDAKRKQVETQLRLTNEELMQATRLKDEFLANMSHELRTPLNSILGMAESLQEHVFGKIHEQQIKPLQMIRRSGTHLLELINDILDVAKIESGQMDLALQPTSVVSLCQSSLDFVQQPAHKKCIQLSAHFPTHVPNVRLDERRMRQVLINLLSNAVKFTPPGGCITLDVSLQRQAITAYQPFKETAQDKIYQTPFEQPPSVESRVYLPALNNEVQANDSLRIAITDTGIGIAPEHISQLFQPFIQIDSALNRKYSGTGLGLALVKRIVELHGGDVSITSKVNDGSCFTIDIPCVIAVPCSPSMESRPVLGIEHKPPKKTGVSLILLAGETEANAITITNYLRAKDYHIRTAINGQDVVRLSQHTLPNLILMDTQGPGIDDLDIIQHIRLTPDLINVPIIVLTRLATKDLQKYHDTIRADCYLNKPFKLKQLIDAIQELV